MKRKKIAGAVGAMLALSMTWLPQPAQADDLTRILNAITGRGEIGFNANEQMTLNNLETTRANLDAMISTGEANGSISPAQSANFRMRLAGIVNMQSNLMANGDLSWPEVQNLVSQYSSLTNSVNTAIAAGAGSGVNIGGGYGDAYGFDWGRGVYGSGISRIDRMESRISDMISRGVARGTLSAREAAQLRAELASINNMEVRLRMGGLNRFEVANLERRLENLRSNIRQEMQDREFAGRGNNWY